MARLIHRAVRRKCHSLELGDVLVVVVPGKSVMDCWRLDHREHDGVCGEHGESEGGESVGPWRSHQSDPISSIARVGATAAEICRTWVSRDESH